MLFALDICVHKKVPPTYSVHWDLNHHPPPPPPLLPPQKYNPFFAKSPLKSENYPKSPF